MADPSMHGARPKRSLDVAREMVQTMIDRGMGPGDRYPNELEALRMHGVGRGTYREALRFLEHQGVLVLRPGPGGGPEIVRPDWPDLASTIALLLQFHGSSLDAILDAREIIEPGMAELASLRATDAELADLAADLDELWTSIDEPEAFRAVYERFWLRLAQASHNELFTMLAPALRSIVNSAGFQPDDAYRRQLHGRLATVLAAIRGRDASAARAAMADLESEFATRLRTAHADAMQEVISWPAAHAYAHRH